ncbi:MAG TPA: TfoX/Sxy family protein [Myxococcaceae bacterium]|nr:TfoX/Sxy family protein [Myxococcaceae bacterium]
MKKSWRKSSEALVQRFSQLVPPDPRVERRQMFGYPAAFAGGNLFMSLFEESMIFRLAEPQRAKLLSVPGSRLFEPMPGRPMREYVVLPDAMVGDAEAVRRWAARALEYALSLPPKKGKAAPSPKKPGAPRPAKPRAINSKRKPRV